MSKVAVIIFMVLLSLSIVSTHATAFPRIGSESHNRDKITFFMSFGK